MNILIRSRAIGVGAPVVMAFAMAFAAPILGAQQVSEILDKYVAAFGGMAKLDAMKSQHILGDISFGSTGGTLVADRAVPNKSRTDIILNGRHLARGYDGAHAWQAVEGQGVDVLSGNDARNLAIESDFYGPLVNPKAKGNVIQLVGRKIIRGKNTYKLQVVLSGPGGYVDYYYLDPTTYLPARWEGNRTVHGQMRGFVSDYLQYKSFDGYMFPAQTINSNPDGSSQAILIRDAKINTITNPNHFDVPVLTGGKLH